MKFLTKYYSCATAGNSAAVSKCLQPAFQEAIDSLPAKEYETIPDLAIKAIEVNVFIEAATHNVLKKCVGQRIEKIDDGISTASDIAQGIGEWCRPAAAKLADVRYLTLTTSIFTELPAFSQTRALADDILRPSNLIEEVLEHRARKRAESSTQRISDKKRVK